MKNEHEESGRYIKAWREHFGLSEKDVCDKLGWRASHYKSFESGAKEADWKISGDIAGALGLSVYEMLGYMPGEERKVRVDRTMSPRELPDRNYLRAIFNYDPDTGMFSYKAADFSVFPSGRAFDAHHKKIGKRADGVGAGGYRALMVCGKQYGAHRMAILYHHGPFDIHLHVDHLNGVRSDNRISNIRVVTVAQNRRNVRQRLNKTGFLGVTKITSRGGGYKALCISDGVVYSMGPFETPEKASLRLEELKTRMGLGFGPNHGPYNA